MVPIAPTGHTDPIVITIITTRLELLHSKYTLYHHKERVGELVSQSELLN